MASKEALLQELESAYNEFYETVRDIDPNDFLVKWQDGRWGVREIAEHHAGWLGTFAGALEKLARGEPASLDETEAAKMDEVFAEHAQGKQKDEVLFELEQAVRSFIEAAEKVPDGLYESNGSIDMMFHAAGITHFREHMAEIKDWQASIGRSAA
jgi:hypothetical protein